MSTFLAPSLVTAAESAAAVQLIPILPSLSTLYTPKPLMAIATKRAREEEPSFVRVMLPSPSPSPTVIEIDEDESRVANYMRSACAQCGERTTHIKQKTCKCGYMYAPREVTAPKAARFLSTAVDKLRGSDIEYVTIAIARGVQRGTGAKTLTVVHSAASPKLQPLLNRLLPMANAAAAAAAPSTSSVAPTPSPIPAPAPAGAAAAAAAAVVPLQKYEAAMAQLAQARNEAALLRSRLDMLKRTVANVAGAI